MNKVWVFNASPIIFLNKLNKIDLIKSFKTEIIIPKAVSIEILAGPENDPANIWIKSKGQKYIKDTGDIDDNVAHWDLGSGETSVISYCINKSNYYSVIDDLAARKCADTLGVKVKGTLGILLLAKKSGLIKNIKPILENLTDLNFRIDNHLYQSILKKANE